MQNKMIIHIPHSSYFIPNEYKNLFYLTESELKKEQLKMTDSFTDELFDVKGITKLVFPISRLICDVERFRNEEDEEMTQQGMWVCYTKTSNLKPLKKVSPTHKTEVLNRYYDSHHYKFEQMAEQKLKKFGKCLIIDAHSFSSVPLSYEIHANGLRPDICIGVDEFHTPKEITEYLHNTFTDFGYKVSINSPFCGTIVPLKFYRNNKNVISVMIEINRSLYINEKTGDKNKSFSKVKKDISNVIKNCKISRFMFVHDDL